MKLSVSAELLESVRPAIRNLIENQAASRLAAKDHTLWGPEAESEAAIRLGWVDSASDSISLLPSIFELRETFRDKGIDRFVLCGMGGSSLAPEVIAKNASISLVVLDSTAPDQVSSAIRDLERTAIIVSSKSGSTVETDSQKRAFEKAFSEAGIDAKERIVIVTDPGSPLDVASRESGYRVFNADPNVGGRYSALTAFGLVPSGLAGADIAGLLSSASRAFHELAHDSEDNPAILLAAALAGDTGSRDKFLIQTDGLAGFGDWVEQLVAESTGKEDRGVLPVVVSGSAPEQALSLSDTVKVAFGNSPADVNFSGDLGELFLLWECATALAGHLIGINPFDQPNVESAKAAARQLLDSPQVAQEIEFTDRGVAVRQFGIELIGSTVESAIEEILAELDEKSYLAIQVYLSRTEYPQFEALRDVAARRTSRPVTFGWGPRFLHSTGQYHKGGPKQGVFIQITGNHGHDLEVPERPFSFAELISAQALGDANVLAKHGLTVVQFELSEPLQGLEMLERAIAS
jgi:glucose-6-phosphate isomerase